MLPSLPRARMRKSSIFLLNSNSETLMRRRCRRPTRRDQVTACAARKWSPGATMSASELNGYHPGHVRLSPCPAGAYGGGRGTVLYISHVDGREPI